MSTTNLQVNAQTGQAVGAFNQLASAIHGAQNQWNRLNNTIRQGQSAAQNYSTQLSRNVGQAFNFLAAGIDRVYDALKVLGVGLGFVFGAVIKELDKLQGFNAIMSVTTSSAADAAVSYEFLRKTADKLGIQFDSLTGNYAKLVAALPEGNDRLKIAEKTFLGISMAARTLHSSNQDIQLMFYAVTQIASKGVVSMEELRRQLGEKLPGAMSIAARAFNTTTDALEKAIRKGIVNSEKFLAGFGDELIRTFGDSSQKASESVSAAINRLTNVWTDFVKYVLDSGAARAIIGVFDELREKLSDPYLIARFAELIKSLADRFTEFIKNISSEDIKTGFDTFARGIDLGVRLFGKLIELMTWVINNAPKAGAIIGGAFGAAAGAIGGPVGMLLGGLAGANVGAYAGRELAPSKNDIHRQRTDNEYANHLAEQKRLAQQDLLYTSVIPKLQQFKDLDTSKITNLLKAENATAKLLTDLGTIQFSKEYKDQKARNAAVYEYAKTGVVLGPNNRSLTDVIGGGKGKKSAEEKSMDATWARAVGLDANFFKEWENLNKLFKAHKIDTEQLTDAQAKLLAKQPFMEEAAKKQKEAWDAERDSIKEVMRNEMELIQLNEKVTRELNTSERMAGMRSDELRVESEVMKIQNEYAQKGLSLSEDKLKLIRTQVERTERLKEVTAAENSIVAQTVDRFRQQVIEAQAMRRSLADPTSGVTKEQAGDYYMNKDQNLQTGQTYIDQQKRMMEDYYAYINMLRGLDVISDDQAQRAKALAMIKYQEIQLQGHKDFFGNLASLQSSGSKKLQAIGKAAAITQATIDAYLAINRALATLPPPLSYAVAASIGAAAFVNVQKIASAKSMWTGGYTGDGASTAIAGVTHGQEFVVNRDATAKNRQVLEAMNRGQSYSGGGGGMKISIENYGTSKIYDVQPLSENEVRIIARDEANTAVATRAPAIIAADLDNPNSKTSKAVSRNVSAPRKR